MELRDAFAAAALAGVLANGAANIGGYNDTEVAVWAYELADEMLKARDKAKEVDG